MEEPELTADDVERGLAEFTAGRFDIGRVPTLIGEALAAQEDDHAASMLRRGGSLLLKPRLDGMISVIIAFTDDAELLAHARAAAWQGEHEQPPAHGSEARRDIRTGPRARLGAGRVAAGLNLAVRG